MPKLSDTAIRAAKPKPKVKPKPYKMYDQDGLYLLVAPTGAKAWRQRYRFAGKEKLLSLGTYPAVRLAEAREQSREIRKQVKAGIDPSAKRKERRAAQMNAQATTFKAVSLAWHAKFKAKWSEGHAERILQRLTDNVFPWIGDKPIRDVTTADVLECLDRLAKRGKNETARRVLQIVKKVFGWAVSRGGILPASPVAHVQPRDELPSADIKHLASIKDPQEFGALLRAIDGYSGGFVVKCALQFIALTFVRPGELRRAEWPEFDLDGKEPTWRIPGRKMKIKDQDHLVPLSRQAIAVLHELKPLTGDDDRGYVFPGLRNPSRPLSANTLNAALRTLGFTQAQHCAHGFRGTASTMLNELQWNRDAIERQLAHMERDKIRAAYNAAAFLPVRRKMMQAWADHCDMLRAGGNKVVDIGRDRVA